MNVSRDGAPWKDGENWRTGSSDTGFKTIMSCSVLLPAPDCYMLCWTNTIQCKPEIMTLVTPILHSYLETIIWFDWKSENQRRRALQDSLNCMLRGYSAIHFCICLLTSPLLDLATISISRMFIITIWICIWYITVKKFCLEWVLLGHSAVDESKSIWSIVWSTWEPYGQLRFVNNSNLV